MSSSLANLARHRWWPPSTFGVSGSIESPSRVADLGRRRYEPSVWALRLLVFPGRSNRAVKWPIWATSILVLWPGSRTFCVPDRSNCPHAWPIWGDVDFRSPAGLFDVWGQDRSNHPLGWPIFVLRSGSSTFGASGSIESPPKTADSKRKPSSA